MTWGAPFCHHRAMRIVVVDGATLNPGDLSWEPLRALGPCEVHEHTLPGELIARCDGADAVLTNKVLFDRAAFESLPKLRYLGVTATGVNCVDLAAASDHGVIVCNVPAYGTASVAQLTIALLLELTTHVAHHAALVRDGRWSDSARFCFWDRPMMELRGATLGIVGLGAIGSAVADIGIAMGMRVQASGRGELKVGGRPIASVELDVLFRSSDVVSLHCPLSQSTRHMVDAARLATMRPTAFLLNTSRGPLIDEAALDAALRSGHLAGAGLDVLCEEPPAADHPLLSAPRCIVTAHLGWATLAARQRLMDVSVANLAAFAERASQNLVTADI